MHSLWKPILEILASNVVIVFLWATIIPGSSNYYVYLSPDEVDQIEIQKTRCRVFIKERGEHGLSRIRESELSDIAKSQIGSRKNDVTR